MCSSVTERWSRPDALVLPESVWPTKSVNAFTSLPSCSLFCPKCKHCLSGRFQDSTFQVQAWRTRGKSRLRSLRRRVRERKTALVTGSWRSRERLALVAFSSQSIQVSRASIRDAEVLKVSERLCLRVSACCAPCAACPTDEDTGESVSLLPHVCKWRAVMFRISALPFLASVFRH